jgi:hypothetical protein
MKVAVELVVLTGTLLTTSLFAQMTWTEATASAEWHRRCAAGAVVFDNKVWVMGGDSTTLWGSHGFGMLNDVWYSTDGAHWTLATDSAEWARRMSTPLVFDGKMWVLGGFCDSGFKNDVWYSTDGAHWTLATDSAGWHKRAGNAAVVFNGMMWVMGGLDSMGQNPQGFHFLNDVWHSIDGVNWTPATASADWSPRVWPTALVFGGEMWVMGGCDSIGLDDRWLNDVWHSTDGVSWTLATASAEWSGRMVPSALVFDGKMWVMGGFSYSGGGRDVWYSTNGAHWTQAVSEAPWNARFAIAAADFNGYMWVMGGGDETSTMNDVWYSSGLGVAEDRASPRLEVVDLGVQPNPFLKETRLAYSPTGARPVKVSIQDISGRQVRLLVNDIPKPGLHSVAWDGRDRTGENVSAGIYFALLSVGGHTVEKKLVKLE